MKNTERIESFIDFLCSSVRYGTFTESARTDPLHLSHDTWRRELMKIKHPEHFLWDRVKKFVRPKTGYLIADDTILDKPFGKNIECVGFHHSGKHKRVVRGICLITLLWTDGKRSFPIDFRIYHNSGVCSKNDHLRDMLTVAKSRGFSPKMTLFDSWYSANETLRLLQSWKWKYMVGLKANRSIEFRVGRHNRVKTTLSRFTLPEEGFLFSLNKVGFHRCFARYASHTRTRYWCTNHTHMTKTRWNTLKRISFEIETYHKNLKQYSLVERCQSRRRDLQRAYIALSLCALVKIKRLCRIEKKTLFDYHRELFRKVIQRYRRTPLISTLDVSHHAFCGVR